MNNNLGNNQEVNSELNSNTNASQNDYYNNDAYYDNSNYSDSYNNTSYEEEEKKSGIWWKILLVVLVLLIIILLLLKFCSGGKTSAEKYAALQTKLCTAANKYVENNPTVIDKTKPGTVTVIKLQKLSDANLIESRIDNPYYKGSLFKKSTEEKYYSMNNSVRLTVHNDGTLNCEMVDNSADKTAPELRLNGDAEITLAIGTEFEDPGYTATDDYDGDITSNVVRSGNVDSSKAGEYTITYSVSDSAGNTTTKTRKVVYEEYANLDITLGSILDTVTPMISLKGSNPYCMVKGTQYVEPGAIATDNVDGDITNRIAVTNKVTGNLMGSFRVVYKVEDSSGNQAIAYRAVIVTTECPEQGSNSVVANNAPVITLIGKNSVTITKGTEYIDLGATAYDKEDGDITSKIITDATAVNVNVAAVYKVSYRVTDSAGQLSTAVRTVTVKDKVSGNPSVRFTETKGNISIEVGEGNNSLIASPAAVNENGVAVAVSSKIEDYGTKVPVSAIDWNKVGKYRVTYTAVHGNGSIKQTKSIVVTIFDNNVEIAGKDSINVTRRDQNCDLTEADLRNGGVTFSDGAVVGITGTNIDRMACLVGTYQVNVKAEKDGKKPATKEITVHVVDGTSTLDTTAPSAVVITGNTANATDPYNKNGVWVGGAVTEIGLTFSTTLAANTELAYFEYSVDCNSKTGTATKTTLNAGTLTWNLEGQSNVCIRAVTTAGSNGPWSNVVKLNLDKTGPTVAFTHTWNDKKENWHNTSTLTLTYDAADSGSGLDHFEYTYDDVKAKKAEEITTYNEGTGSLVVKEDTESSRPELFVYVRAVDKAGNTGEWTTNPAFANIDTVKPNAPTLKVIDDKTSVVKIEGDFEDGKSVRPSGFGSLQYEITQLCADNGGVAGCTDNTVIGSGGSAEKVFSLPTNKNQSNVIWTVAVASMDKAGNKSDSSATIKAEVAPAKITATGLTLKNGDTEIEDAKACLSSTVYVGDEFTLTATPIPTNSDEKIATWGSSNADVVVVDADGKITIKKEGKSSITATIGSIKKTCTIEAKAKVTSGSGSVGGTTPTSAPIVEKKTCYCTTENGNVTTYSVEKSQACSNTCSANNPSPSKPINASETKPCYVSKCSSCSGNSANSCVTCASGYHKQASGTCVKNSTTKPSTPVCDPNSLGNCMY